MIRAKQGTTHPKFGRNRRPENPPKLRQTQEIYRGRGALKRNRLKSTKRLSHFGAPKTCGIASRRFSGRFAVRTVRCVVHIPAGAFPKVSMHGSNGSAFR